MNYKELVQGINPNARCWLSDLFPGECYVSWDNLELFWGDTSENQAWKRAWEGIQKDMVKKLES